MAPTICDVLEAAHIPVWGVGKIPDIFAGRGITCGLGGKSNRECLDATLDGLAELERGFLFANLVETDMLWGHRNDTAGYARALEEIDARVPAILSALEPDDRLIFTADHGCDRRLLRRIIRGRWFRSSTRDALRVGASRSARTWASRHFADVAATIAALFDVAAPGPGMSSLSGE